MDINVEEFMQNSTKGYNFQYLNVKDLNRIIRNVQRTVDVQSSKPIAKQPISEPTPKSITENFLTRTEVDCILKQAEEDLLEPSGQPDVLEIDLQPATTAPEPANDNHSSSSSSTLSATTSTSSIIFSPSREGTTDDVADVEDNLFVDDDFDFEDQLITTSREENRATKQEIEDLQSLDTYYEFLDSESIAEEVLLAPEDQDGDSEGSLNVAPVVIRVRTPVRPRSNVPLTESCDHDFYDAMDVVKPVIDFEKIERESRRSRGKSSVSVARSASQCRSRPASEKSLIEEFDTFIKITELQKKICMLIDDVRLGVGKIEEIEDVLEEKKREKRTAEFLVRFQRNYLYQINRIEEDVCVISKSSPELSQKVYQLYKFVYDGLKFYLKNMKYFVINVSPEKLWSLVKQIMSSTKVCIQKGIFDEDDLIVGEINEKCHALRHRLKEEASRLKTKMKASRDSKRSGSVLRNSTQHTTKLSMYGAVSAPPKRRPPVRKVPKPVKKPTEKPKNDLPKEPSKDLSKRPGRGKIIAVPMNKSSSSSLGQSKSSTRLRSAKSPRTKPLDEDVVTQIQTQADPLINSRLLKEVSSALTKLSSNRDAAISPEVNQQLHQLIMETIQNITRQQLKEFLEQPITNNGHKVPNQPPIRTNRTCPGEETVEGAGPIAGAEFQPSEATEVPGATGRDQAVEKCFSTQGKQKLQQQPPPQQSTAVMPEVENSQHDRGERNDDDDFDGRRPFAGPVGDCESGKTFPCGNANQIWIGKSDDLEITGGGGGKMMEPLEGGAENQPLSNGREFIAPGQRAGFAAGKFENHLVEDGQHCRQHQQHKMEANGRQRENSLLDSRKRGIQPTQQRQQKINYSHNLQYLEIVSPPDGDPPKQPSNAGINRTAIPEARSHLNLVNETAVRERKQQRKQLYAQLKRQIFRDRLEAVRRMSQNPIYVNGNFDRPWQTVSRISDQLVDELVQETTEQGLDFGERSFVEDFIRLQLGEG
ncbi:uncharacterized protein LOC129739075 [Uranotaenia lowii]|uniref:uncharacterized protein LOC129739075 n=1 Tax=Uranotaenia lowii TaxID=190385 RepID=UPI0024786360|nr:uncharacterized protein LOC129739075 [Uranotaenia lowii]